MELLNFLLYTTAFSQLSYSCFFDFCVGNMFLKYAYYVKPVYENNSLDITWFIMSFMHISLHLMVYYLWLFIQYCKTIPSANYMIKQYNWANKKYIEYRTKFVFYGILRPMGFIVKKIFLTEQDKTNEQEFVQLVQNLKFKVSNSTNGKPLIANRELKTNEEINGFLNKFMTEKKT